MEGICSGVFGTGVIVGEVFGTGGYCMGDIWHGELLSGGIWHRGLLSRVFVWGYCPGVFVWGVFVPIPNPQPSISGTMHITIKSLLFIDDALLLLSHSLEESKLNLDIITQVSRDLCLR